MAIETVPFTILSKQIVFGIISPAKQNCVKVDNHKKYQSAFLILELNGGQKLKPKANTAKQDFNFKVLWFL